MKSKRHGRGCGGKNKKAPSRKSPTKRRRRTPVSVGVSSAGAIPFSLEVSNAIRHHVGRRKDLESKRKSALNDRDAALDDKHSLKDKGSKEYLDASHRHSDAVASI